MALAGLKKQFNKANQYVSEKMGATEGTKLTEEYTEMEKRTDGFVELVDELLIRTKEHLQPNPATRAKLMLGSKVMQTKSQAYVQPEGSLGECMIRASKRLGEDSNYALSLNEMGEAMKQMAEIKFAFEDNVKQNFLEPLTQLQNKDVRDVQFHRKKLEGRRLDFDCKRRRAAGTFATPAEIKAAEDKFEESFNLASKGMHNLLNNETEHISLLTALAEALLEYHTASASILQTLSARLNEQKEAAASRSPAEYLPKKLADLNLYPSDELTSQPTRPAQITASASPASSPTKPTFLELTANNGTRSHNASPLPSPVRSPARTPVSKGPCCQALYDFDAENPGELAFKEGDIITLTQRIDSNWFQGSFNGKTGMFPVTYVQILVPLP